MKKLNSSIQVRLFLILSISVLAIVFLLITINTFIYRPFYVLSKKQALEDIYRNIDTYYNQNVNEELIIEELEKIALINGIDILIKTNENTSIYASNKDFVQNISQLETAPYVDGKVLEKQKDFTIREVNDKTTGITFMVLSGKLDNGYYMIIRLPISAIDESAKISNTFLYITGTCVIIIAGIMILFVARSFTRPILELEDIAKRVSNLDFSKKYKVKNTDDEIDNLGKSINRMSSELEKTINMLQEKNLGLERDIEEKSKIDEMRKQFISDVSHELKTPIALIQGYAEGLKENINSDEESRNSYVEVIIDEANKMDILVKRLLELMKLEYQALEFNNVDFDIVELINETIRKSMVMIEEKGIEIRFEAENNAIVHADEFYIETVITNYLTNAIKYATEVEKAKYIEIKVENNGERVRVSVFNTGNHISIEDMPRVWNRFYKTDISRNREDGSTGIGLAFVKAIMNNYDSRYGVQNLENGVEFYFELDKGKKEN